MIINAVSDAVKRNPNLVEVTVESDCCVFTSSGLLKGVLQKANARKVDVIESQLAFLYSLSKRTDVWNSECECLCVCVVSAVCSHVHCVSTCRFSCHG